MTSGRASGSQPWFAARTTATRRSHRSSDRARRRPRAERFRPGASIFSSVVARLVRVRLVEELLAPVDARLDRGVALAPVRGADLAVLLEELEGLDHP